MVRPGRFSGIEWFDMGIGDPLINTWTSGSGMQTLPDAR
jgi:hypothetical protein